MSAVPTEMLVRRPVFEKSPVTPIAQYKSYMFCWDLGVPYDLRRGMTPPTSLASDCSYMSRNMVELDGGIAYTGYMLQDTACNDVGNHRWFEHCACKGDLHYQSWRHGSVDRVRENDVGFFTSSLASYIEKLRSSFRMFCCTFGFPGDFNRLWPL